MGESYERQSSVKSLSSSIASFKCKPIKFISLKTMLELFKAKQNIIFQKFSFSDSFTGILIMTL